MQYSTGSHCVFYHRYHIVWSTKYRYKVLQGDIRLRVRDICRQVCREKGVDIVFAPDPQAMYPAGFQTQVRVAELTQPLEGRTENPKFNR